MESGSRNTKTEVTLSQQSKTRFADAMNVVECVLRARGLLRALLDGYERPLKAVNPISSSAKDSLREFIGVVDDR